MPEAPVSAPELSVTLRDILSWSSCYSEGRVRELAAAFGRERITALEALDLPIPPEDRLWLVLRTELVPEPLLHEFACRCAEVALDAVEARGGAVDPLSRAAIRVKRAWVRGEADDAELSAAWSAAWSALSALSAESARSAAWSARSAAWSAASAAESAAESAAWSAASAARSAASAARSAASAARSAQVEILRSLLSCSE